MLPTLHIGRGFSSFGIQICRLPKITNWELFQTHRFPTIFHGAVKRRWGDYKSDAPDEILAASLVSPLHAYLYKKSLTRNTNMISHDPLRWIIGLCSDRFCNPAPAWLAASRWSSALICSFYLGAYGWSPLGLRTAEWPVCRCLRCFNRGAALRGLQSHSLIWSNSGIDG